VTLSWVFEIAVFAACGVFAAYYWFSWYVQPFFKGSGVTSRRPHWILLVPLVAVAMLYQVPRLRLAEDWLYLTFYVVLGLATIALGMRWLSASGINPQEDVFANRSLPAAYVVSGALIGTAFCLVGSHIGYVPGWWTILFRGLLATGALFLWWKMLDRAVQAADHIIMGKDTAAGLRAAGFFIACGIVFGRGIAGRWESIGHTFDGFFVAVWPLLVFFLIAAMIERSARPSHRRPVPSVFGFGVIPAVSYVLAAGMYVLHREMPLL
jgi:hypothetical protein